MDKTICPICFNSSAVPGIGIGTCKSCRVIIATDRLNFLKAAELAVIKQGRIDLKNLYQETRKAPIINARRMLIIALFRLAGYNSRKIAALFNVRGRNVNDSSIRHSIYVAEDLYNIDKKYKILIDDFLSETLRIYKTGDNILKDIQSESFIIIKNCIKEETNISELRASLLAQKIIEQLLYNNKAPEV